MSLTNHQYHYFSNKEAMLEVWKDKLDELLSDVILEVYGVWEQDVNKWFDDAPMIVRFTSCALTVNVSCEMKISLTLNDLDYNEKPVWFDETECRQLIEELSWHEDLVWKIYSDVDQCFGKTIEMINVIGNDKAVTGIEFNFTDKSSLTIKDVGDVISAFYTK